MVSRYPRYDPDRRSRSPRDRSPDRFDRAPPYDQDRRRSSAESRGNSATFPPNRDPFGDSMRRDPPRGPKALIDTPPGHRGGFGGDFRGGRGRGRGRPWPARDDSRERGRDRDIEFRDRYRDDRSRDRERDRDRDRDWRDRDFARRRSPIGRPRSPTRDFRDRDRDPLPPVDVERPQRASRDGGPPSAGSSVSDPSFSGAPFPRGGGFIRTRGRGGRGEWGSDRGRGRTPYDDRGDRYPRSRSQEGRWGRERDDRERGDRYPEDARRDIRDDRDRIDREHVRAKLEARTPNPTESTPQSRDVSPPPVAPSAPAFGSVPSRGSLSVDGLAKPSSMPRAHGDRPPSSGHLSDHHTSRQTGPDNSAVNTRGPPSGLGRPLGRRIPDSPKAMRPQSIAHGADPQENSRSRSGDAGSDPAATTHPRSRSNYSAEPGEIIKNDNLEPGEIIKNDKAEPGEIINTDSNTRPDATVLDGGELPHEHEKPREENIDAKETPAKPASRRKRPSISGVRFTLPPQVFENDDSESDDDEEMADFFDMQITKTEAELSKLQKPKLPLEVLSRYASLSHGSMVKILDENEGLIAMLGEVPDLMDISLPMPEEESATQTPAEPSPIEPSPTPAEATSGAVEASPQAELKPLTVIAPDTIVESEMKMEAEPQPEAEFTPELKPELKPEPKLDSGTESKPDSRVDPELQPEPQSELQPEPKPGPQRQLQPETQPKSQTEPEPEPETQPETQPQSQSQSQPELQSEPSPKLQQQEKLQAESQAESQAQPELQPKSQAEPESEPEPKPRPEPELQQELHSAAEPDGQPTTIFPVPRSKGTGQLDKQVGTEPIVNSTSQEKPLSTGHEAPKPVESTVPMEITETGSKVPSTPSQVEDNGTESENEMVIDVDSIRQYMATPPSDSLPNFTTTLWEKDAEFLSTLGSDPEVDSYVSQHMSKVHLSKDLEQNVQRHVYAENYKHYLNFTASSDPVAVKSRDKFSVAMPIPEPAMATTPEPKPEGRTSGRRFASERDLERVLQASMREDEERKEREQRIQKEKYRSDKEADIPTMYWDAEDRQKAQFWDHAGYVPQDRLVSSWQVLAPIDNFTEEEAELFEKRYLENPKQWGKIAEMIPNRDFGTCIQYYYLKKKDLKLKDKLKKQPKRRKKGRGKQRSSALMSELGNADPETEDNPETGDNGERRRPRRAAAPTWGFEQPAAVDPDTSTPVSTPGRRARADGGEKADGGKRRGRKSAKDKEKEAKEKEAKEKETKEKEAKEKEVKGKDGKEKETKEKKTSQALPAASTPGSSKSRPRSSSRIPEAAPAPPMPSEVHPAIPNFEQAIPSGIQPPFSVHSQPMTGIERHGTPVSSVPITEVLTAASLRPEPPPPSQSALAAFNLSQSGQDRKTATQPSSYWSVSESTDFPLLLAAFGSDWNAIANHMGSKTAVMVKNYFVRQKEHAKPELEVIVQEADAKRMRGEKRPEPPTTAAGGRGRRYDVLPPAPGRPGPFGMTPGIDMQSEPPPPSKQDHASQPSRAPAYPTYGIPIAKAPSAQGLGQGLGQAAGQAAGQAVGAQGGQLSATQPMSPNSRTSRGLPSTFGFPDRERDIRGPLAPGAPSSGNPDSRDPRAMGGRPESLHERQKAELSLRDAHNRDRERERELARQSMRVKQEEMPQQHAGYEPFSHRQQPSVGRSEPLSSLGRQATTEQPSRSYVPGPQPGRGLLGDSGPGLSPPMARPMSTMGSRPPSREHYPPPHPHPPPQSSTPVSTGGLAKPSEPRKTSNIMSLLNDDPPPALKRVSEVSARPVATPPPPPQAMARPPQAPHQPAPPLRREQQEAQQYHAYARSGAPHPPSVSTGMPSLKPTQPPPVSGPRMGMEAHSERDYYRQHSYPAAVQQQQGAATTSPPAPATSHRYGAPHVQGYQPSPGGYPTQYGSGPPHQHAGSPPPPPQYASHGGPRMRESAPPPPGQSMRDNSGWPTHQQQGPGGNAWQQGPGPKMSQGPPPQSWSPAPQPQPPGHSHGMREERAYSTQPMQSRYAPPPASRPQDPGPPPGSYGRYSSTPVPRDPREMPGRSYTPVGYDGRAQQPPPPPHGAPSGPGGYGGPSNPRDGQMRDGRDARDMMARGLRPQDYDRRQDRYGR